MWTCFLLSFQNKCNQNVGTWWCRLFLVHLTTLFRIVTKFLNSDIVSLASPRGILEPPSAVFSICQNLYQKLVFCWHVYDTCTNYKFINWYPDVTIGMLVKCTECFWRTKWFRKGTSTVYAIVEIKQAFLDSTKISASEEPNALEKAPVQFMPLQKFSGKCHFLIWFCTSNWNGTCQNSKFNFKCFIM